MILGIALGIVVGLLIAVLVMLSVRRYQTPIERTIKQAENRLKEKGEIFIESDEKADLEVFLSSLPKE